MSDEDRKAFWEWWKNGSNDDPEDAWLAALAWDRGRQKVLQDRGGRMTDKPKREWVGLTQDELVEAYIEVCGKEWCLGGMKNAESFYDSIERRLKEKNA